MTVGTMESLFSTCTILRECGISARQLYYWEMTGLIQPRYESFGTRRFRRYTSDDLSLLKNAKILLDSGFTLQSVRDRLAGERKGSDAETVLNWSKKG